MLLPTFLKIFYNLIMFLRDTHICINNISLYCFINLASYFHSSFDNLIIFLSHTHTHVHK